MRKSILLLTFAFLYSLVSAQQKGDKQFVSEFNKLLSAQFKANETGAAALVARNGEIIYKRALGMANLELNIPMQVDHIFRIGSITKQFTAVAILQLMEQGKLSLQDDITQFIPDYPTQGYHITIEHLLTHTSGIKSYTEMDDFEERMPLDFKPLDIITHFKNQPMDFAPGTQWKYSNSGYFLLGYIIERVTNKSYAEYIEENFFRKIGMSNSLYGSNSKIIKNRAYAYSKGEQDFENAQHLSMTQPYSAGSIMSTVEDLYKWHQALHSYKIIKKENLDKAFARYKLIDGKETDYGYGWGFNNVQESPTIEHSGGINGFLTIGIYVPNEDVFVAVFSNCECNPPMDVAVKLAALAIGKPYKYKGIIIDSTKLQNYTGLYENEKGERRIITSVDNKLYSQRGENKKYIVTPFQEDKFFFENFMTIIEFSKNSKGEIESLTTKGRGKNETWVKSNKPILMAEEVKLSQTIMESYAGAYELKPQFIITITCEQGKLFAQATGQGKNALYADAEDKFSLKAVDAQIEFVKDDSGKVIKLILNQGGYKMDANKIK
jgi:CubicO group peptidase (beta-lactamase class C family)